MTKEGEQNVQEQLPAAPETAEITPGELMAEGELFPEQELALGDAVRAGMEERGEPLDEGESLEHSSILSRLRNMPPAVRRTVQAFVLAAKLAGALSGVVGAEAAFSSSAHAADKTMTQQYGGPGHTPIGPGHTPEGPHGGPPPGPSDDGKSLEQLMHDAEARKAHAAPLSGSHTDIDLEGQVHVGDQGGEGHMTITTHEGALGDAEDQQEKDTLNKTLNPLGIQIDKAHVTEHTITTTHEGRMSQEQLDKKMHEQYGDRLKAMQDRLEQLKHHQ